MYRFATSTRQMFPMTRATRRGRCYQFTDVSGYCAVRERAHAIYSRSGFRGQCNTSIASSEDLVTLSWMGICDGLTSSNSDSGLRGRRLGEARYIARSRMGRLLRTHGFPSWFRKSSGISARPSCSPTYLWLIQPNVQDATRHCLPTLYRSDALL